MVRAVLDTNVIISGSIMEYGPSFRILKAWEHERFVLIASEDIIQEVDRVFHYPRIKEKRRLRESEIRKVLGNLREYGEMVPGELALKVVIDDPDDDKFLIAAVEGRADYIVSGDPHLKDLSNYRGTAIIPPVQFAMLLERQE